MEQRKLASMLKEFDETTTPSEETIKDIILAFLDFLEERIENENIDEILEKIEAFIKADSLGLFRSVFNAIKLHREAKRA